MGDVEAWFVQQRAIQTRGQKTKARDAWRRKRIGAIKAAMNKMGVTNETYYPELARQATHEKTFISLKDLTTRDLDRIYGLVMRMHDNCDAMKELLAEGFKRKHQLPSLIKMDDAVRRKLDILFNR